MKRFFTTCALLGLLLVGPGLQQQTSAQDSQSDPILSSPTPQQQASAQDFQSDPILSSPRVQRRAGEGFRIGPLLGLNFDGSSLFIGGVAQFGLDVSENLSLIAEPSIDLYLFEDNITWTRINLDAVFPFEISGLEVYGGGGLMIQFVSIDSDICDNEFVRIDCNDTDIGLNIRGGILFGTSSDSFRPFVEANIALYDDSDFAVRGGLLFQLGGRNNEN